MRSRRISLRCSISTESVAARFWDENDEAENNVVANFVNRRGVNNNQI
jgi:hypothetical protein